MNKLRTLTASLLLSAFAFTACDKDDDTKPAKKQYTPEFSAKVDSTVWVAKGAGGINPRRNMFNMFSVEATDGSGITISLESTGDVIKGVGTYTQVTGLYQVDRSALETDLYASNFGGSAELIITKYDTVDNRISGTFSFTAPGYNVSGEKVVTDGVFKDVLFQ